MNRLLFVYGTLRPGSGHPLAERLASEVCLVGPAWVRGALYDLGGYPGLVLRGMSGSGRVRGDLLALRDPEASLAWLDVYEGCAPHDPRPHEYRRREVEVTDAAGRRLRAWAWLWQGRPPRGRRIPGGDWLHWLAREPRARRVAAAFRTE